MIHTVYLTFHTIRNLKLSVFRDFQPWVHERERKKMLKTVIWLETRYRKILAKLLRVSSEKQGNKPKGKNMIKNEIVQRKEKTHGEIRTPLARGVSSQRSRCCGMVGSVKLLTLKQSSLPYALFEACGAVLITNSNVHLRTNGFNDNFGVMLYYFSVNPIDVWSWAETEQSLMWSIGHIDRRGKNQFTVGFP